MSLPKIEEGAHKTILLVHSDMEYCNSVASSLKGAGFGVVMAQDGEVAMTLFDLYKDQIVLTLLDVVLPKKDGLSVLQEIKGVNNTIPVIILTNLENSEDIQKAMDMGAREYIIRAKSTVDEITKKVKGIFNN